MVKKGWTGRITDNEQREWDALTPLQKAERYEHDAAMMLPGYQRDEYTRYAKYFRAQVRDE